MAWRNQKGASNLHPTGRIQAMKKWIFGFSFQTFGTFDAFRMVVDLGYIHDFGTSWCFRFQSLPGSDLMVTVEAKQLQAHGEGSIVAVASKIEEKPLEKPFESNG